MTLQTAATGPPQKEEARPRMETLGAGEVSSLEEHLDSSVGYLAPTHKEFSPPWRDRFVASLTVELGRWLANLTAGEPLTSHREVLTRALHVMSMPTRERNYTRRPAGSKPHA
jgi:hypothetical protein